MSGDAQIVLKTPGEAIAWAASQARVAAKGIAARCPEGRYALGAVTALLEFADALDPPKDEPASPPAPAPVPNSPRSTVDFARGAARLKGYTGDCCPDCGSLSMVRNGMCLKCDACGATTGCS